jgi:hypothetical protein
MDECNIDDCKIDYRNKDECDIGAGADALP